MKIVGLTGGIGSGKTTVAYLFAQLGAPVFFADDEAKLVYEDPMVVEQTKKILGSDKIVDANGKIIRSEIAAIIFQDPYKRNALNELIHPLVKERFAQWILKQDFEYCIREAAILIESNAYRDCDEIIVVTSAMEQRVKRVMDRDGANKVEVENRIKAQMSDEDRLKYATFVIENNAGQENLKAQVLKIHLKLI